jgi:hypothetical protein
MKCTCAPLSINPLAPALTQEPKLLGMSRGEQCRSGHQEQQRCKHLLILINPAFIM